MSTTIDRKILEMRFDNKDFQNNVAESISTLDKLKAALNFDKVGDAFGAITAAAGKVDLSSISMTVETIGQKFSAMEIAAITAIQNIVNKGLNWLQSTVNNLTFDQVNAGWDKYAQKTESVQTIMAATGKGIEEVSAQLDRLNWFSDETSYSFVDMTSNVGKFTSAGVELEDAVEAMQGISTWAALSGAKTAEASRAMYNLSQAMAVGEVKLMDWRSIENAGMATMGFKEVVLDTAAALGTLTKYADGTYQTLEGTTVTVQDFNSALSEGWFTKDVLMESLSAYGSFANELSIVCSDLDVTATDMLEILDAYDGSVESIAEYVDKTGISADKLIPVLQKLSSEEYDLGRKAFVAAQQAKTFEDAIEATKDAVSTGWLNIFESLFGNYEEAASFFTDMSSILWDIFAKPVDDLKWLLREWEEVKVIVDDVEMTADEAFRKGLLNTLEAVSNVITFIQETIAKIIPPATAEQLAEMTGKFTGLTSQLLAFTENLKVSEGTISRLQSVWKGFTSVIDIFKQAFSALQPVFAYVGKAIAVVADDFLSFFAGMGEWIASLADYIRQNQTFQTVITKIGEVLSPVHDKIVELYSKLKEKLDFSAFIDFETTLSKVKEKLQPVLDLITKIKEHVTAFFAENDVPGIFNDIWGHVKNIADTLWDLVSKVKLSDILSKVWELIKNIGTSIADIVKKLDLSGLASGILNVFRNLFHGIETLFKNFNLGDLLSSFGKGVSDLVNSLGKADFSGIFKNLFQGMMIFQGVNLGKLFGSLSGGIDDVTGKVKEDGIGGIFKSMFSPVTDLFDQLKETIGSFTKETDDSKLKSVAIGVGILAGALWLLGTVNPDQVVSSLELMGGAIAGLLGSMFALTKMDIGNGKGIKNVGMGMLEMAGAMFIIAKAVQPFAEMDEKQLAKAGAAMTVILGEMLGFIALFGQISKANQIGNTEGKGIFSLFQKSNGYDKQLKKVAEAMILIGAALKVFAWAAKDFGNMEWESLGKAGAAMTVILAEFWGLSSLMQGKTDGLGKLAFAMIEIGAAMKIFASASKDFGDLGNEEFIKAVGGLTLVMVQMGLFIFAAENFASSAGKIAGIAASMVILGVAMKIFASVMKDIAEIGPYTDLAYWTMVGITGVMVLMMAFMNAFAAQAGGMIVISAAMVVLGLAMKTFASAAKDFTDVRWEDLGKIAATLGGLVVILTAMGALSPILGAAVGILTGIGTAGMLIGGALILIGTGLAMINFSSIVATVNEIGRRVQFLGDALVNMANSASFKMTMEAILASVSLFAQALGQLIGGFVAGFISGLGTILSSIGDLLSGFTDLALAFFESVKTLTPALVDTVLTIVMEILTQVADRLPEMAGTVLDLIIKLLDIVAEKAPQIVSSLANLFCKLFDALSEHIPEMLQSFMNFIGILFGEILKALDQASPDAVLKMIEMVGFISALVVACSLLAGMIPGAMVGLLALGGFIAELALILAALGALTEIPHFLELVEGGGNLLQAIGTAIGQFVGGIIGGIAAGATASLPKIADNLSEFMDHLKPFINGVKEIDSGVIDSIGSLAGAILTLTAADILSSLTSFFTGKSAFEEFGNQLEKFGPKFAKFASSVSGINPEAVRAAGEAISNIASVFSSGDMRTGGVIQWFKGELTDLEKFGDGLVALAPKILEFTNIMRGLDPNAAQNAAAGAEALFTMNEKLPRKGGLVGWLKGDGDLVDFAKGVAALGPSIMQFAVATQGLDAAVVERSLACAQALSGFADGIQGKTFSERLFGGDKIGEFVQDMLTLGNGIGSYYTAIEGVDPTHIRSVTEAVKEVVDMASTSSDFGKNIDSSFADSMAKIAEHGINEFVTKIESSFETVHNKGSEFFRKFIEGMEKKKKDVENTIKNVLDKAREFFDKLISDAKNKTSEVEKAVTDIVNAAKKILQNARTDMKKEGEMLIIQLREGMDIQKTYASTTVQEILNKLYETLDNNLYLFKEKGSSAVTKFADGVNDSLNKVEDAGYNVAHKLMNTVSDELEVNSPSRTMYQIGYFAGEGFVNGLYSWVPKAGEKSAELGETAMSSLAEAVTETIGNTESGFDNTVISSISDAISQTLDGSIDTEPVIRPVLDLTEVEKNAEKIKEITLEQIVAELGEGFSWAGGNPFFHEENERRERYQNVYGDTNIYVNAGSADAREVAKEIGAELSRKTRRFNTI